MKTNNSRSLCIDWIKIWSLGSHFKINLEDFISNPFTELKNSSNDGVAMRKNPLQVTCDLFRMVTPSFHKFSNFVSFNVSKRQFFNHLSTNLDFPDVIFYQIQLLRPPIDTEVKKRLL